MAKPCSCALNVSDFFQELKYLLAIWSEHTTTGKLSAPAGETGKRIKKARLLADKIGDTCDIDVRSSIDFLAGALDHYEGGLMRGDVHNISEAAEQAAETELIMLRTLWVCQEKE